MAESNSAGDGFVFTGRLRALKGNRQLEVERVFDVGTLGFFDRRWLVSRKKNRTLGDYTNQWRKTLIDKLTELDEDFAIGAHLDNWT